MKQNDYIAIIFLLTTYILFPIFIFSTVKPFPKLTDEQILSTEDGRMCKVEVNF